MSNLFENFSEYATRGIVPTRRFDRQVPQNCFYKSVYYIDSVVGPVKDMFVGVNKDHCH